MLPVVDSSATRFWGTMALGLLLFGPALSHTGCDSLTGIDELTFERGVNSFCGPDHPCPDETYCELADSRCRPQQGLATQCTRNTQCLSGRCVHDFCCNGPCNAICLACDLPGSEGYCGVVPTGEDPHGHCPGTTACGADGRCQGRCLWSQRGGASGSDLAIDVAIDGQDNVFVVGTFEKTLTFDSPLTSVAPLTSAGESDVFLAKLTSDGETIWSRRFGSPAADQAAGVAVDQDGNVIVAANFAGPVTIAGDEPPVDGVDAFIIKLDGQGEWLWDAWLGISNDPVAETAATDLAVDPLGNVIATGHFTNGISYDDEITVVPGSPYADVFIVKLDAALGTWLWNWELGAGDAHAVQGGSVAMGGSDFVITSLVGRGAVASTNGTTMNGSTVDDDLFLLRLDATTGQPEWGLQFGGLDDQHPGGLAVDLGPDDGTTNIWLTGTFANEITIPSGDDFASKDDRDGFYVKLGPWGAPRASGPLAGPFDEVPRAVAIDPEGNAIIVGHFELALEPTEDDVIYATGGTDLFFLKLDSEAQHLWARPFGGVLLDDAASVATDSAGSLVAVGRFEHTIDFGCKPKLDAVGDTDFFVVKLGP